MSHGIKGETSAQGTPKGTTICGIVGVVFGALGLVLSFIPIVNNIAAILGAIGVVLAIIAMVGTFRGKKAGKILSIVAAVLSVLAIVITLAMQSAASKAIDEAINGSGTSQSKSSDAKRAATIPPTTVPRTTIRRTMTPPIRPRHRGSRTRRVISRTSMSRSSPRRNRATTMKTSLR